jgi:RHS repeat-associated protein
VDVDIFILTKSDRGTISIDGTGGEDDSGGAPGGSGSGGSIRIEGDQITLGDLSAEGGLAYGVSGGVGRIAIYYKTNLSYGTTMPSIGYVEKDGTPDSIFADGFESGDLSAWTSSVIDGGDLTVSSLADYWGKFGLKAVLDDTNALYLQDDTPISETRYRARFYLDPSGLTLGTGEILDIFTGISNGTEITRIQLQDNAGEMQLRASILDDSDVWTETSWIALVDGWQAVEIEWQAIQNEGFLKLWLEDVLQETRGMVDNDTRALTVVRLGAMGVDAGTSGVLTFDDFEARRYSYIGLLPDPGIPDPEPVAEPGWLSNLYAYDGAQPHAVTAVARDDGQGGGTVDSYEYDANGNMTCRVEGGLTYIQDFNAENRLSNVQRVDGTCDTPGTILEQWIFAYDGDGIRVKQVYTVSATTTTTLYFFGGAYETTVETSETKSYYSFAGQTLAMDDGSGLKYFLSDHLGSMSAVLDASGNLLSEQRYLPFGQVRGDFTTLSQTDYGYTGQRDMPGLGLMDYRARFYLPGLGKFIQPDSIIPNPGDSQAWNRYAYTYNNPLRYTDYTGHFPSFPMIDGMCGSVSGCMGSGGDGAGTVGSVGDLPDPTSLPRDGHNKGDILDLGTEIKDSYLQGWTNFSNAWTIASSPHASKLQKKQARSYIRVWGGAHFIFAAGALILAAEVIVPGSMSCVMNPACKETVSRTAAEIVDDIALQVANHTGGVLSSAQGSGWRITFEGASSTGKNIVARVMISGGGRLEAYYRVAVDGIGAVTSNGQFSTNPLLTHHAINLLNPNQAITEITNLILGLLP